MEKKIHQYLEGNLSEEGQKDLLHWLRKDDNHLTFDSFKKAWWQENRDCSNEGYADFGKVHLNKRIKDKQQLQRSERYLQYYKYAAIAMLVLALAGSVFVYQNYVNTPLQFTEIHTELGQVSSMTLPDGTEVWINSGTKLSYNNQYGINNRYIKVKGEAFFSVTKDKTNPLIVDMGAIKVEVTGTQFGISNYDDLEQMNVVLEEGSVNIRTANDKLLTCLKPDELALFNKKDRTIEKLKVKSESYTSWKDGIINIFELPLEQLVVKLEKRYNQQFEVEQTIRDIPYTFSIEGQSLSDVLYLIERISPVKAIQQGDIIKLKYEALKH